MAATNHVVSRPKTRGPRLYHKKSRTGCIRCKQRRVKCDETRPSCNGCSRHAVKCVYPILSPTIAPAPAPTPATRSKTKKKAQADALNAQRSNTNSNTITTPPSHTSPLPVDSNNNNNNTTGYGAHQSSPASSHQGSVDSLDDVDLDFPESRERRIWELRLLHNSLTQARPFPSPQPQQIQDLFAIEVPNMALQEGRDGILYGIMAHSALNMWTRSTDPQERETLIRLQRTYLDMLLQQQRKDLAELSPATADAVCLSSLKILTHALALIQTLPLEPWQPPVDFLRMGNGAGHVFKTAWSMVGKDGGGGGGGGEVSRMLTFLRNPPILHDPKETVLGDHSALDWILETPPGLDVRADPELVSPQVRMVYEQAIAYICSVQRAIDRKESEFLICRRLGGFAVWVRSDFTKYLIAGKPRAMVVMAHFMALFLAVEHIWIIGKAGQNQVRGIHKNLPVEWRYKVEGLFEKFRSPEDSPPPFVGGYGSMM